MSNSAARGEEVQLNRHRLRRSIFSRLPARVRAKILKYLSQNFDLGSELIEALADVTSAARAVADITRGCTFVNEFGWAEWDEELGTFCYVRYRRLPPAPIGWVQFQGLRPTWHYNSDMRVVRARPPVAVHFYDPWGHEMPSSGRASGVPEGLRSKL